MPKSLVFMGDCLDQLRDFPPDVKQVIGFQLYLVQVGQDPTNWKPMRAVGHGVIEIRIHARGEYRVLLIAKHQTFIYVLHAFLKKSRKTDRRDLALARARMMEIDT
jgi:phage-related protein